VVGKLHLVRGPFAVNEDHDSDVAGDQFGFGLIDCQDSLSVFG